MNLIKSLSDRYYPLFLFSLKKNKNSIKWTEFIKERGFYIVFNFYTIN